MEICLYCGEPRKGKIGCCGENHWEEQMEELEPKPKEQRKHDVCQFCDEKQPNVSGPRDTRPYVCIEHRHLAHMVWPKFFA